jgi:TPP-dependent pyruvate/acetoin dehydrogenase alpha subunit
MRVKINDLTQGRNSIREVLILLISSQTLLVSYLYMGHDASLLLGMYRTLHRTRALEDQVYYLYHNQNPERPLIIGKGYLSTGQEAISVGAGFAVRPEDWVAPSHRDMGLHLTRGMTPKEIFAQYFCRATGPTRGRDGNVHFGCTEKRILGFVSHMGASLPVANGLAWADRYRGESTVVLAFYGDGASSQGCVHEAMNYAAVFKLPVIFVCNNNRWAISTPLKQQAAVEDLSLRAQGYGFEGVVVDGNDTVAVYDTVSRFVEQARGGGGPALVECKTLRMSGHGTHDPAHYIPREEREYWRRRDPLLVMRKCLEELKLWDEMKEKALKKEVNQEMQEAITWAAGQPLPRAEELLDGVYS